LLQNLPLPDGAAWCGSCSTAFYDAKNKAKAAASDEAQPTDVPVSSIHELSPHPPPQAAESHSGTESEVEDQDTFEGAAFPRTREEEDRHLYKLIKARLGTRGRRLEVKGQRGRPLCLVVERRTETKSPSRSTQVKKARDVMSFVAHHAPHLDSRDLHAGLKTFKLNVGEVPSLSGEDLAQLMTTLNLPYSRLRLLKAYLTELGVGSASEARVRSFLKVHVALRASMLFPMSPCLTIKHVLSPLCCRTGSWSSRAASTWPKMTTASLWPIRG